MKAFRALTSQASFALKRMFRETSLTLGAQNTQLAKKNPFAEPHSKHRNLIPLYDLSPEVYLDSYVAPNATVVGEVSIGCETTVWYGAVIRGDVNSVKIGNSCSIGENTVIHTAGSLPTGIPATVELGSYVNVQGNCTLYSCTIDDEVYVGFKTVILEGSRLERGCAIGPNSVVPPGRIIPGGQLWAGNPVEYVRDLSKSEIQSHTHWLRQNLTVSMDHRYEYLPYNSAYLQKENTQNDENPSPEEIRDRTMTNEDL